MNRQKPEEKQTKPGIRTIKLEIRRIKSGIRINKA